MTSALFSLLSMLGGGFAGFLMKYWLQKAQDLKEERAWRQNVNGMNLSNADAAAKRVPLDYGKGVRRIIVLGCMFAVILASFILTFFGKSTFVEITQNTPEALFGLIPAASHKVFVEIPGYFLAEENRQVLLALVSFYFGSNITADKS